MTRSRTDQAKNRLWTLEYNLRQLNPRAWWDKLDWFEQILVAGLLWGLFVLVAFPQFADLVERAVRGQS